MSEFFMRDAAPFGADTWKQIDEVVEHVARQQLVGRRFVELYGPLGFGAMAVPLSRLAKGDDIYIAERELLPFALLQQDFHISGEDLAAAAQGGHHLDMAPVAEATVRLALQEDEMIFAGLRKAKGAHSLPLGEWDKRGGAFATVAAGLEKLTAAGVYGPYALVLNTKLYAQLQRVMAGMGRLEIAHVRELLGGEVYFAPTLTAQEGFLIANSAHNLDLAVAQDMVTAYLGNEGLHHTLSVMEKVALRIKRPSAICLIK